MLAAEENVAVPLTASVVPAAAVNEPVPSASVSARTPPFIWTDPKLAQGMVKVFVPAPVLRSSPSLTNLGLPEFKDHEGPLLCRSKVALAALLKTPPLQITWPAVHAPAPSLTSVPPFNDLVPPPSVIPPLAKRTNDDPAVPKNPPVHENGPDTAIAMVP